MNTDYLLTIGMLIGLFSIPAMLSAYADLRPPRFSMAAFILAMALMAYAYASHPGGYDAADIPNVVVSVIADIIK
ncbi:hypothetical protein Q8W37_03000 [Shimia thalassica]|jgi:hypothetical protein|uniref:50S ribosomal protein L35 n=1 Tax=Shimia thalassica TaxID=1715693 RepID=A0A0P1IXV6_9RHOB|nr:hypothetical protein [Shimia thalassica]PHO04710.1 hypothetical protein CSC82_08725 [Rhodobacteraceae bacterium 4F10]MBU2943303.1 hypothetical protein [Shimia thalassica]MDO6478896.1 hypothetical protein [Shimia thalassica]MDO6484382.1 hypothetical protein [Shimia thalassica]MDO6501372.1 hypothetical protein [Shimia thalassica]